MDEAPPSTSEVGRRRLRRFRSFLRSLVPFVSGVFAVLVALLLYNALVPPPHQITTREVNDTVAQALASATPPPAYSARVYQTILPSLVLVQTLPPGANSNAYDPAGSDLVLGDDWENLTSLHLLADANVGSGVIIDDAGDILTSLHVVSGDGTIQVTFADGTQSSAQIVGAQPENDIAVLQRRPTAGADCPRHAGQSQRPARRRRSVRRRQSLWPVQLDERRA